MKLTLLQIFFWSKVKAKRKSTREKVVLFLHFLSSLLLHLILDCHAAAFNDHSWTFRAFSVLSLSTSHKEKDLITHENINWETPKYRFRIWLIARSRYVEEIWLEAESISFFVRSEGDQLIVRLTFVAAERIFYCFLLMIVDYVG